MSVLIRGMKMPKSCSQCNFCQGFECVVLKRTFNLISKGDCPLVETVDYANHGVLLTMVKQTNADRFRAKSDEELAKALSGEEIYPWCTKPCEYDNCTDCVLAWLKQEAEI